VRAVRNACIFGMLFAAAMVVSAARSLDAAVVDRIVAVVNNDIVTLSDLNRGFEPYRERFDAGYRGNDREKAMDEAKREFLDRMVDNLLMEQEAKKTGISVSDADVSDAIADLRNQRNISEDDFRKILDKEKISMDSYRQDIKNQLTKMRLVGRDIKAKVAATDEEIGAYYQKHREDYDGAESVRLRQILLTVPEGAASEVKGRIRADVENIRKRLLKGERFEELCARFSQGPGAAEGGDIGYIEKGAVLPEIDSVAFSLPQNKLSEVIESPAGFHIIEVTDRRGAGAKPIDVVREEIKATIDREKMEKKYEEWLKSLREKSNVEIRL